MRTWGTRLSGGSRGFSSRRQESSSSSTKDTWCGRAVCGGPGEPAEGGAYPEGGRPSSLTTRQWQHLSVFPISGHVGRTFCAESSGRPVRSSRGTWWGSGCGRGVGGGEGGGWRAPRSGTHVLPGS